MILKTIVYRTRKYGTWYVGLEIENDRGPNIIINRDGKILKEVYEAKDSLGIQLDMRPILSEIEDKTI